MKIYKYISSLFLLIAAAFEASAQSLELTLEDCHTIAEQNNAAMRNAELDVKAARLQKDEAFAEFFPRISAMSIGYYASNPLIEMGLVDILGSNDFTWNLQNQLEEVGQANGFRTKYYGFNRGYSASLNIMQPLYAGGRIVNGNRLASLGVEAARLQKNMQVRKSTEEIDRIWWEIAVLEDKKATLEYLDGTLATLYSNLQNAIASGLASHTDSLQLSLKRGELKSGLKQIESGIRLQKMNLLNTLGAKYCVYASGHSEKKPYIDSISFKFSQIEPLRPEDYWRDENDILNHMDEKRLLDLQVEAKELEKKMAIGESLPQVAVGLNTGYSDLDHGNYSSGSYNTIAFATVQIPISDWWKTSTKAKRIQTQIDKAQNDRDFLSEQLHVQIGKLWLDLTSAYDQWQIAEENLRNAQALYKVALSNYEAGMIDIQELLQAETACHSAGSNCADALANYRNAIIAYTQL